MKSRAGRKRFAPWLDSLLQEWAKRHDFYFYRNESVA
ncbi:hypothetical protein swp_0841 [Shewanella piezotolerans WP3]|uniref:Uncharacterized protein n=1 Tax=Shewanella piezotolerans (strain WP3 / JCM 13877) TaxID=225849 RepID=B8CJ26_SHEPW|nr:hypothetical protein swp_0841 [Shewanella piezotolerans WP3]